MKRLSRFLISAPAWRGLLEGWLISGVLLASMLPVVDDVDTFVLVELTALVVLLGAGLAALRIGLEGIGRRKILIREVTLSLVFMAGLLFLAVFTSRLENLPVNQLMSFNGLSGGFILLLSAPGYLAARVAIWLWLRWDQMRRTRFLWALTNAHLTVVILIAFLVLVFGIITSNQARGTPLPDLPPHIIPAFITRLIVQVFPWVLITGLLAVGGLLLVLPPSALFSFLVARRMTRRLEKLVQATNILRSGDLSARVQVEGEDEVAQLQTDFNAMASDLQAAAESLQAERDKVAGLLRVQRELTASVSHELRTPVTAMHGYLESLLARLEPGADDPLRADLEVIAHETDRLEHLIEDLFTLSRAEVNQLSLTLQPVNLDEIITRVVGTVAPLAWDTGKVEVHAELTGLLPAVQADPARLEQVLRNLVHNGVRHTPPGGIVVVTAQDEGSQLRLDVIDTGEGISTADLPHIWERFYQAGGSTRANGSAGLGLAIVKELSEAMGGRVSVESRAGEGSRFSIWLNSCLV